MPWKNSAILDPSSEGRLSLQPASTRLDVGGRNQDEEIAMRALRNLTDGAVAVLLATAAFVPTDAEAITAELAKKCNLLLAKQFPPLEPGNPAAGSSKGNGQAGREYFKKCVDNNGNMDNPPDKNAK
jgi:hypothetical protein